MGIDCFRKTHLFHQAENFNQDFQHQTEPFQKQPGFFEKPALKSLKSTLHVFIALIVLRLLPFISLLNCQTTQQGPAGCQFD
jgi:hypothetical protein